MGGFLAWSALASLAEGLIAYGALVVESNRKVVQHLEGGIIDQILIKEGDVVEEGQALMVLTDIAASSGRDYITADLMNYMASVDRLNALRDNAPRLVFNAAEENVEIETSQLLEIQARQTDLFNQQKNRLNADVNVLESRKSGLSKSAQNAQAQIDAQKASMELIVVDLDKKRGFLSDNLISGDAVFALERDLSSVKAELSRLEAAQQTHLIQIEEVENQVKQTQVRFTESITQELLETRVLLNESRESLRAAQDVVNRSVITAPIAGEILNLNYTTIAGIVSPGERILEIVPNESRLIASVEVPPSYRDSVYVDLEVRTRLTGLESWNSPTLEGKVIDISADLKTSPRGDYSFYEARISLIMEGEGGVVDRVTPGMPVESFILSGQERTFLQYLLEPITAMFRRGARG